MVLELKEAIAAKEGLAPEAAGFIVLSYGSKVFTNFSTVNLEEHAHVNCSGILKFSLCGGMPKKVIKTVLKTKATTRTVKDDMQKFEQAWKSACEAHARARFTFQDLLTGMSLAEAQKFKDYLVHDKTTKDKKINAFSSFSFEAKVMAEVQDKLVAASENMKAMLVDDIEEHWSDENGVADMSMLKDAVTAHIATLIERGAMA